jgi:hypothetical protein
MWGGEGWFKNNIIGLKVLHLLLKRSTLKAGDDEMRNAGTHGLLDTAEGR